MAHVRKKRKVVSEESKSTSPIVFHLATHEQDMKLRLFGVFELHVHSIILKMHSAFFRKFLDSPDKQTPLTGRWRYEWVSCVDEDGTWSLVDIRNTPKENANRLKGEGNLHQEAFHKFIGIFYGQPWKIEDIREFTLVVGLADYYCALPLVSRSFDGAFFRSPKFLAMFKNANQRNLLSLAIKVRHSDLFRDCMIMISGNVGLKKGNRQTQFKPNLGDPTLDSLAMKLRNQINKKIISANRMLRDGCSCSAKNEEARKDNRRLGTECTFHCTDNDSSPRYYRGLEIQPYVNRSCKIYGGVVDLLRNNITFCKSRYIKNRWCSISPDRFLSRHFLFADIKEKDIPWDASETDW